MLDKLEWIANHILTRLFGAALISGSGVALYQGLLSQWPAVGLIVFGAFCVVPTKFKAFIEFLKGNKEAFTELFKG